MLKKVISLTLVMAFLVLNISNIYGSGVIEAPESVRIGLVTYFEHVDVIHFYNDTVVPGYYENDTFYPEVTISTTGQDFWFTPAKKYYLESEQTFATYEAALAISAPLRDDGYKAYPTLVGKDTWKVFAGHKDSLAELDQVKSAINGLYDVTYEQAPESYERVFMESESNDPVLFENRYQNVVFGTEDLREGSIPVIDLGKRSYRGYVEVGRYGRNDLSAINVINLDDYLYSVVVSEIYASWPEESLKAQAVAARTFAVFYIEIARKYPNDPFDLNDTISSQVYKGFSIEDERVRGAVDETSGELIYFDGEVIPAYFFAASGGRTENSENVWSGTVPYLKSVPDIYETEPERGPWVQELTPSDIEDALASHGVNIGSVTDIEADGYTEAGRVLNLKIYGTSGTYDLKKETMRYWLGINSRKFVILKNGFEPDYTHSVIDAGGTTNSVDYRNAQVMDASGNTVSLLDGHEQVIVMGTENIINEPIVSGQNGVFLLAGEGWGHGAGMSQAGAKGMANEGFTYREILGHYYTGTVVQ